ncbi:Uncharacterised protein [Mycobacteroides abscessus subsp. abscessus]|nr:Uncharacterised protein [Mycobacteroides abscessus subsp. abscessus]
MFARSEPVPGSVMAIANMMSPEANPGSHRCFCSSVAYSIRYGRIRLVCTDSLPKVTPASEVSSDTTSEYVKSCTPPPPYSSGTSMPSTPNSPSLR